MATESSKAAQDFVPIKEIRDGVIILKDGGMRSILMASSINFALKSTDEQQSIIFQFQNFLNSLNFSVQIFTESRRLDIRPYIALLEGRYKDQTSDMMKIQTREYIDFIKAFTESTNIMTKTFFVVVPYSPAVIDVGSKGFNPFSKNSSSNAQKEKKESFEEHKTQLDQRLAVVEQGLVGCGVRVIQLGTEELVEVFYKLFNPGDVEKPIPVN